MIRTIIICLFAHSLIAQDLQVEGAISIGNEVENPIPGTIKWSGTDFMGWNGEKWISLTTGIAFDGQVQDADGNVYRTIKIGSQEWMVDNLRTTKFSDSSDIQMVNNYTLWENANYGAWCWYDTTSSYEIPYGKIYNWYAVNDSRGLCPEGWSVPTDDIISQWGDLVDFIGGTTQGGKLKESGTAHWRSPNVEATNSTGFTARPGGARLANGSFAWMEILGYWWSSSESDDNAWHRNLFYDFGVVGRNEVPKNLGMSVRCIKN